MRTLLPRFLAVLLCLASAAVLAPAGAAELVRVGGYDFPPYVDNGKDASANMVARIIDRLNQIQGDYRFEFVPVAARRRYADLVEARFDVMFFESPQWGWQGQGFPADFTRVFMTGAEVYVTQAVPGRGEDYFDTLAGKSMVGILGYHYGFAGFEGDPDVLARKFDLKLVNSHRSSIELVLSGRRSVGVVTDAYLNRYLRDNPTAVPRLLVSRRTDQVYEHRVLVRRGGPIAVAVMDKLMEQLVASGEIKAIAESAGIAP